MFDCRDGKEERNTPTPTVKKTVQFFHFLKKESRLHLRGLGFRGRGGGKERGMGGVRKKGKNSV